MSTFDTRFQEMVERKRQRREAQLAESKKKSKTGGFWDIVTDWVLPVVGAVGGGLATGGSPMGIAAGYSLGSAAGSAMDTSDESAGLRVQDIGAARARKEQREAEREMYQDQIDKGEGLSNLNMSYGEIMKKDYTSPRLRELMPVNAFKSLGAYR